MFWCLQDRHRNNQSVDLPLPAAVTWSNTLKVGLGEVLFCAAGGSAIQTNSTQSFLSHLQLFCAALQKKKTLKALSLSVIEELPEAPLFIQQERTVNVVLLFYAASRLPSSDLIYCGCY